MNWRFDFLATSDVGEVLERQIVTDIIEDFSIEKTLGDQFWVKSGDIRLRKRSLFPLSSNPSVEEHWLAAYIDNAVQPFEVYLVEHEYMKKSDKFSRRFENRLESGQKIVFDDFSTTLIKYDADTEMWGNHATAGAVHMDKVYRTFDMQTFDDRWGFSPTDMLKSIEGYSNYHAYKIKTVELNNAPQIGDDDLPIIFRGDGADQVTQSTSTALDLMFYQFPGLYVYEDKWLDLLKIFLFAFNSFCYVKPNIFESGGSEYLGFDLNMIPKTTMSGNSKQVRWLDRNFDIEKFQLDGVRLTSTVTDTEGDPSFVYELGNPDGNYLFERDIDVCDPSSTVGTPNETRRMSFVWGDYLGGIIYQILEADDTTQRPYWSSGLIDTYYQGMLDDGGGWEGELYYNGEDILDNVDIDGETLQITSMRIDKRTGRVKVEGPRIA